VALELLWDHHGFERWTFDDIQRRCELLERQSIKASSVALVATSMAAKFLRNTGRTTQRFPEKYLAAEAIALDQASRRGLAAYAQELLQLELTADASALSLTKQIAPGFGILADSIEAVAQGSVAFLREGRRLWKLLLRGLPGFSESYRGIINPDAGDGDIVDELFVPIIFVPDWLARSKTLQSEPSGENKSEYRGSRDTSDFGASRQASKPTESMSRMASLSSGGGVGLQSRHAYDDADKQKPGKVGVAVGKDLSLGAPAKSDSSERQILASIRTALISSD
jgi:hypothetical protein